MISIEWMMLYGLTGAFVGFMAGLLGVGGGGIMVPLLVMIFRAQGMNSEHVMHYALGTTFACMILSSIASTRKHASNGNVVWKAFYGMAGGIIFGTFLTTCVASHLHSTYIALFFACFMGLVAIQMFFNWRPKASDHPANLLHLSIAGTGIGSVSALAAVGGGFLAVTYLHYKNIPMKKAIGTSAAIGFPIALAGTLGYWFNGSSETIGQPHTLGFIYLPAFIIMSLTSIIMASVGAGFSQKLSDARLKKIFALVCLALSIKMFFLVV
jgi:uncharacterized membrane protein YfcA